MSKSKIRNDKTCLNCKFVVENKFCPNCGQENIETRQTFHHLFFHFFEDLTHYDNTFWRTIKNLLLKPAALSKEYVSGKRLSYLAPVRLYIFISFVTFLVIAMVPISATFALEKESQSSPNTTFNNPKALQKTDTLQDEKTKTINNVFFKDLLTVAQLDSIQKQAPASKKLSDTNYWLLKKLRIVAEQNTVNEIFEKFLSSFGHNLPKVLFIIMPLFAFFLWLFHNKKKWYYFDHGIFTLHYFSFLLLLFLILYLLNKCTAALPQTTVVVLIENVLNWIGIIWMVYYFFPAHHRFYGETRRKSFLKSSLLFLINFIIITFIISLFALYTLINLH